MQNLDLECAKLGRVLAELDGVVEKLLINALSVLEEQGIYACFLYLKAPVQRVTGFDTIMPYYKLELEYLPDAPRIAESIQQCAAY